jgi:hypothetical protein
MDVVLALTLAQVDIQPRPPIPEIIRVQNAGHACPSRLPRIVDPAFLTEQVSQNGRPLPP